ncbi:MAG: transposase [Ekhidna sp.]
MSFSTVHWIDLFVREEYKHVLIDSLKYCQKEKGLEIYAWCFMSSHLHLIIGTRGEAMQNILRDFKSFTSRKLKDEIKGHPQESRREWILWMMERAGSKNSNNSEWQLWQQHNQPIELDTNKMLRQRLDYLHMNPVEAGFVSEPEHWNYSSAIDYAGGKGLIDICFIE